MGFSFRIFEEQSTQTKHVRRSDSAWRPQLLNLKCFPNVFDHKTAYCALGTVRALACCKCDIHVAAWSGAEEYQVRWREGSDGG